jgi:hypothetical protein
MFALDTVCRAALVVVFVVAFALRDPLDLGRLERLTGPYDDDALAGTTDGGFDHLVGERRQWARRPERHPSAPPGHMADNNVVEAARRRR